MPNVGFGGQQSGGSYSAGTLYSDGIALPRGRAMADGNTSALITALYGYVRGWGGGSRVGRLRLGSAVTGNVTATPHSNSTPGIGYFPTNRWLVNGGTARFSWEGPSTGPVWFGKGGGGTVVGPARTWAGTLGGAYTYWEAPTAPGKPVLSSDTDNEISVSWSAPSDNGGTAITGYRLRYSKNSDFSGATIIETSGTGTSRTLTDLDGGDTYYGSVAAKNAVTAARSSTASSVWSAAENIEVTSSGGSSGTAGIPPTFEENPGALWTLAGHNVGFDIDGNMVPMEEAAVTFQWLSPSTSNLESSVTRVRRNSLWAEEFEAWGGKMYADGVLGDSLLWSETPDDSGSWMSSRQIIAFKTAFRDGSPTVLSWVGGPNSAALGTGQTVTITLDPGAELATVSAERWFGGIPTVASSSSSISNLDMEKELLVLVHYWLHVISGVPNYSIQVEMWNPWPTGTGGTAYVSLGYAADGLDLFTEPWQITGLARAVFTYNRVGEPPFTIPQDWEVAAPYHVESSDSGTGPVLSYNGNVWDYLQMAAAATNTEITVVEGVPTALDVGVRNLDITNVAGSPSLSTSSLFPARNLQIEVSHARPVNSGLMFDAAADGHRTFGIGVRERRVEAIVTRTSPQTLLQPAPTSTYPNPDGTYVVTDSEDNVVDPALWLEAGGEVAVAVGDNDDVIEIHLRGPGSQIPGTVAPYTVGTKIGDDSRGALRVIGSGLYINKEVLIVPTGADPDTTPTEFDGLITNPFISSLEVAYDRAIWTSTGMVAVTLSGTLPLSVATQFGLVAGSMIRYHNNIFRVTSATMSNLDVSFDAVSHCVVAELDTLWDGETTESFDDFWTGYETGDVRIMPLKVPPSGWGEP